MFSVALKFTLKFIFFHDVGYTAVEMSDHPGDLLESGMIFEVLVISCSFPSEIESRIHCGTVALCYKIHTTRDVIYLLTPPPPPAVDVIYGRPLNKNSYSIDSHSMSAKYTHCPALITDTLRRACGSLTGKQLRQLRFMTRQFTETPSDSEHRV